MPGKTETNAAQQSISASMFLKATGGVETTTLQEMIANDADTAPQSPSANEPFNTADNVALQGISGSPRSLSLVLGILAPALPACL
ncbi:unnamed protein product [Sympodiomycopsis kandeliae]